MNEEVLGAGAGNAPQAIHDPGFPMEQRGPDEGNESSRDDSNGFPQDGRIRCYSCHVLFGEAGVISTCSIFLCAVCYTRTSGRGNICPKCERPVVLRAHFLELPRELFRFSAR